MSDSEDPNEAVSEHPQTVEDINGHRYQLKKPPLGEGGQGRVYRTENAEVLVKLVCENSRIIQDESKHKLYRQRFGRLLELDLAGIQVASPETLLTSPWCGYSMRLVRDMVPIKCLLLPSGQEIKPEDYVKAGGLRRRLEILTSLARVLSSLHSIPVGYGDISPENIFISEKPELNRVWLIDADNMHLANESGAGCFTPGYAAPELAQCGHSDCRSDVFGFACLSYNILCQHEAFNRGEESGGGGWSCTATASKQVTDDEAWLLADVPWVHDEDDPCDAPGIPWEIVCSPKMQRAFHDTLGKGRLNPDERPSMRAWQTVLSQSRDALVCCPNCRWDYYLNNAACPVCGNERPAFIKWDIRLWHPELDAGYDDPGLALATEVGEGSLRSYLKQNDSEPASAPAPTPPLGFLVQQLDSSGSLADLMTRHCFTLCEREVDKVEMQVSLVGTQIRLDACSDRFAFRVADETGYYKTIASSSDHPLPTKRSTRWWLHTGDLDNLHRVLIPTWIPAAKGGGQR